MSQSLKIDTAVLAGGACYKPYVWPWLLPDFPSNLLALALSLSPFFALVLPLWDPLLASGSV